MKFNIFFIVAVAFGFIWNPLNAQENQKKVVDTEFKVTGVCQMCEKRIEEAAYIKGVKYAEWKKEEQTLRVIYKTKHTSEMDVHEAVAEAGHDTEKVKATDESYSKLPDCCAYRDGVEVH